MNSDQFNEKWNEFEALCRSCSACPLRQNATNTVIYRGGRHAPLMIVGEAPGANEDMEGRPFVGRSGQLLQSLLSSYGFSDEDYHICNICKCRPPQNRRPEPTEINACKKLLAAQFRLVRPKVILLCGSTACEGFFGQKVKMGDVRGRFIESNGYYIMTTYHPAYALRDPKQKIPIYEDMGKVRAKLEELGVLPPLEPVNPDA
ncbi:MAG: uracil-DNA glycosylase [Clostridiales bacterium]|nr:uracil-DNA glycosylase [Clostridiales bacterium]